MHIYARQFFFLEHFTAHTISCVCHNIRSMFRVLWIYNFGPALHCFYSRVHISWNKAFFKIEKKPLVFSLIENKKKIFKKLNNRKQIIKNRTKRHFSSSNNQCFFVIIYWIGWSLGQKNLLIQRTLGWLNLYGCEAVQHKLKSSKKTQKHFWPIFEPMSDSPRTI